MAHPVALPHINRLSEVLELDSTIPNGLRWKAKLSRNTVIGSPAGRKHGNGYWEVRIDGILYKSSRVIYKLYNDGEDPGLFQIDHLDRDKDNNSGANLVLASRADQQSNMKTCGIILFRNVTKDKRKPRELAPYQSLVSHRVDGNKINKFLGYYSNPYEAAVAALVYKKENGLRYEYAPGGTV